jgi:SP family sugar:H+ symporter-like MFS transporter
MTFSVALGTFSFAYNSYLLNGPLDHVKIWINIDSSLKEGTMMSVFNFGGLIGCLIGILIVKKTSRRLMLYLIDILLIVGTAGLYIQSFYLFILFRGIAGLGSGLTTLVTPMFLKEIIPTEIYGVLGG